MVNEKVKMSSAAANKNQRLNSVSNPQAAAAANAQPIPTSEEWSTGLYDCSEDPNNCFATCCCPFITFGRNVDIIDRGKTSPEEAARNFYMLGGCAAFYSYPYRTKLRQQFALKEEPCGDCLVHLCCTQCALCQEYRELKNRGLDPSVGWAANEANQMNQNGRVAPEVEPAMTR